MRGSRRRAARLGYGFHRRNTGTKKSNQISMNVAMCAGLGRATTWSTVEWKATKGGVRRETSFAYGATGKDGIVSVDT